MAKLALEKKAEDITVLDMRGIVNFCDFFVIASGLVDRHVRAIAQGIAEGLKNLGLKPWHAEGEEQAQWILLDFGDCVVHIFEKSIRDFYDLEYLWQDAPRVALKR
ncbi:MAG: ribosome silencing factor [Candidatus Omnitrophota bacterium]|nr:ribosome silencing factor [Candidatus Omnitrophota bacterium]